MVRLNCSKESQAMKSLFGFDVKGVEGYSCLDSYEDPYFEFTSFELNFHLHQAY